MNRVVENRKIAPGYYYLEFLSDGISSRAVPGQFVMMRISMHSTDPLLRRPFSIMHIPAPGAVGIVYKIAGRGTRILSEVIPGGEIDCMGPLGVGFSISKTLKRAYLLGGGAGTPPLVFLAAELHRMGIPASVFLGARRSEELILADHFRSPGQEIHESTDDGSRGYHGTVTAGFAEYLRQVNPENSAIYACGPEPMLKSVAHISQAHSIPTQVSLESQMACGIGACLGCTIQTLAGPKQICSDGPVFDASTIQKWIDESPSG
ncbi:dihydroorotate dehydrogenase electron transfer subunit [bacterium]|nr:dihydroorotate dehydrogenase electron transfer subunit [candidate division CSSED10-310 bacterium]